LHETRIEPEMKRNDRNSGRVRIIGGEWRGRLLPVLDQPGLRPSGDRTRETLFNWLQAYLPGSRCLDLFAGSGALGLEAASRGAARVTLVEQSQRVAQCLRDNIRSLQAETVVEVVCADALAWLRQAAAQKDPDRWDLVFLDPPWDSDLYRPAMALLLGGDEKAWADASMANVGSVGAVDDQRGILNPGALIYLEYPAQGRDDAGTMDWPGGLSVWRQKRIGQAWVCLLRKDG